MYVSIVCMCIYIYICIPERLHVGDDGEGQEVQEEGGQVLLEGGQAEDVQACDGHTGGFLICVGSGERWV
jgi:hypothetical protein